MGCCDALEMIPLLGKTLRKFKFGTLATPPSIHPEGIAFYQQNTVGLYINYLTWFAVCMKCYAFLSGKSGG